MQKLAGDGLVVTLAARATVPFGPVMRARADLLQARGLIAPGERTEALVVIRAIKPSQV